MDQYGGEVTTVCTEADGNFDNVESASPQKIVLAGMVQPGFQPEVGSILAAGILSLFNSLSVSR